jgi:hypothetical protein
VLDEVLCHALLLPEYPTSGRAGASRPPGKSRAGTGAGSP